MKHIAIALLVTFAACVAGTSDDVQRDANACSGDLTCPAGWYPAFNHPVGCLCEQVLWPPAPVGSRSVPATCAISDGDYRVSWTADVNPGSVRPAFMYTTILRIDGDELSDWFTPTDRSGQYALQWVDQSLALASAADGRVLYFDLQALCDGTSTVSGTLTVNLPYLNPEGQVQTYHLLAQPM